MTTHIVAISGGKDSVAMALRLQEVEPRGYRFLITPTGNELPVMVEHLNGLADLLGSQLLNLAPYQGNGLRYLIEGQTALPNNRARWCTRMLKVDPACMYMRQFKGDVLQYVGLRADEEEREGLIGHAFPQRFPLREWGWGLPEVVDYLKFHNIVIPRRTDCAWCYDQRLSEWKAMWKNHPDLYADAADLEEWVSRQRGRKHTFRSANRDNWPAGLRELAEDFAAGRKIRGGDILDDDYQRCSICRK